MKNLTLFLFSICILLIPINSSAQKNGYSHKLRCMLHHIGAAPDSIRKYFQNTYDVFRVESDTTVNILVNFSDKNVILLIPKITDVYMGRNLIKAVDSLAVTTNFWNKEVANKLYNKFVLDLLELKDSLVIRNQSVHEVDCIIDKIVLNDLERCARYTDVNIVFCLDRHRFSPAAIEKLSAILRSPLHNIEEAKVIAQREMESDYLHIDTIGFAHKIKNFTGLNHSDIDKVKFIYKLMQEASNIGLPYERYLDTLRQRRYVSTIKGILMQNIPCTECIVSQAGSNYVHELASAIDDFYTVKKSKNEDGFDCVKNLARLQYRDYENMLIQHTKLELDSVFILLSGQLNKVTKDNAIDDLFVNYRVLSYINTQESYCNAAPLLLRKEMLKKYSDDSDKEFMIGARFFLELNSNIENFPWDIDEYKDEYVNDEFIEKKMPKDFLEKMYKWMIENKGNYKIKQY
jgi:hypothetical protein